MSQFPLKPSVLPAEGRAVGRMGYRQTDRQTNRRTRPRLLSGTTGEVGSTVQQASGLDELVGP
jgi:hypothetical protein